MASLRSLVPRDAPSFDRDCAAHLARRAGFGATPEQLDRLVELGLDGAVSHFVDCPDDDPALDQSQAAHGSALSDLGETEGSDGEAVTRLRVQWLWRMVQTQWPLRERLALLWHDHFATAESKVVRGALLRQQYATFQRFGGASFRELLGAIAHDPAMLVYLDNRVSKKKHPNENWARELFELFTLGVNHYQQRDVAEVARVFTGWGTRDRNKGPFEFDSGDHDTNDKLVLGHVIGGRSGAKGEQEGEEVLDLLVARPECAHFISGKLAQCFLAHEPPAEIVEGMARTFAANKSSIRETLRKLFSSEAFFAPQFRFQMHKTPVEWAVSAGRLLGVRNVHLLGLDSRLARMGMRLFEPPSVAGWEAGRGWAQSSQLAERFELALSYSALSHSKRAVFGAPAADFAALCSDQADDSAILVRKLSAQLLQRDLEPAASAVVVAHLERALPIVATGPTRDHERRERVRAVLHMLLCAPEFSLA